MGGDVFGLPCDLPFEGIPFIRLESGNVSLEIDRPLLLETDYPQEPTIRTIFLVPLAPTL